MNEVSETALTAQQEHEHSYVSDELITRLYQELRHAAARLLADESRDESLNPTALVHEAYLRLLGPEVNPAWQHRGHFFCAAAQAMRRILIERGRRRKRRAIRLREHLAALPRTDLLLVTPPEETLEIVEAIDRLCAIDAGAGQLVSPRYFAGLTVEECAKSMGISRAGAYRHWSFARAWLHCELLKGVDISEPA